MSSPRLKFGTTILDTAGTASTVLGTAMSTLYLHLDSNPLDAGGTPSPVVYSENEDGVTLRFFLTYEAADAATLLARVKLIKQAITDPPGTSVTLESASGTTIAEWTQANQDYVAITGSVNVAHTSTTIVQIECVVLLSRTPYKGAGGGSALSTEGRAGPIAHSIVYNLDGLREITLRASFVPLGDATTARANATAWLAAVRARTAANLTWLPGATVARDVGSVVDGSDDLDSKTLGVVEASITLRELQPDLITLDGNVRAAVTSAQLIPRERGGIVGGGAVTPGYDLIVAGQFDFIVAAAGVADYPTAAEFNAALNVALTAILAQISTGLGLGSPQWRSVQRTMSGTGGRREFLVVGTIGGGDMDVLQYSETVNTDFSPAVSFVPIWNQGTLTYKRAGGTKFVSHTVTIAKRGEYAEYKKPEGLPAKYELTRIDAARQAPQFMESPATVGIGGSIIEKISTITYTALYTHADPNAPSSGTRKPTDY